MPVEPTLKAMSDWGISVVRTWGFNDGERSNGRRGPTDDETTRILANLRKVVDAAHAHHIKVILSLTNYW